MKRCACRGPPMMARHWGADPKKGKCDLNLLLPHEKICQEFFSKYDIFYNIRLFTKKSHTMWGPEKDMAQRQTSGEFPSETRRFPGVMQNKLVYYFD
jgi:hypothetical protein